MAIMYPYKKYNYKVTVGKLGVMWFSEISGSDIANEPIEYRNGMEVPLAIPRQSLMNYNEVMLKTGIIENTAVYEWLQNTQTVNAKEDIHIDLVEEDQKTISSWVLQQAFPVKLALSERDASRNELAVEFVVLACEGIERHWR